mmetsp:Transcript_6577/g.9130  ORF Transcript_6577/g.9130 Transcript_6577/m.9130 type:complete len:399 (+) Transcript_6577:133-1329(+)
MLITPAIGYFIEGNDSDKDFYDLLDSKLNNSNNTKSSNPLKDNTEIQNNNSGPVVVDSVGEDILDGVFDLSDSDYVFYRDHILAKGSNHHYVCADSPSGPYVISVAHDESKQSYVSLVRSIEGNKRIVTPYNSVVSSWWRRLFRLPPSHAEILYGIDPSLPATKLKKIMDPRLPPALLSIEEQQQLKGFKFGILYAKEGQTKEDEMFSNVETSPQFEDFLDFLGDRIVLDKWTGFRGGLDVRSGTTGTHTIYTKFNNNEVIFHVSTMLPFNPKDKQQLERKRHIGNDIVIVLFQEGETVFKPTAISSRQVQVILVVKSVKIKGETYYRFAVVSREGVPEFGPAIPKNALFKQSDAFRNFFYAKLLNAEKASYSCPVLSNKLVRTRTSILRDIAQNFPQ